MHPEQNLCKYKTSLKFAGNNNHNTSVSLVEFF